MTYDAQEDTNHDGIVYVLVNEAMPGYVKIGRTRTSVEQRLQELYTTPVPLPFECIAARRVPNAKATETLLHDTFEDRRVTSRREFFEIPRNQAVAALQLAGGEDVTPTEDYVETEEDKAALNEARKRRANFNFRMVDIEDGTVLRFSKDEAIECHVADHRRVDFEGEVMSLNQATLTVLQRLGYNWQAVCGPDYWMYEGETLAERRKRMEEE
jgi:hypothetical protein